MNRFGVFGIHLGISLLIFILLGYLILFHWYPDFFFASDGGWQGIRIIAIVDLILGPSLTLIVFKRGKPGLKADLTIIGVFQLACLSAGTYVVYSERPIAVVYSDGYFLSMSRDSYLDVGAPVPRLSHIPGDAPKWVTVTLPDDPYEQGEIRSSAWETKRPLRTISELYAPFSVDHVDFDRDAFPLEHLRDRDRDTEEIPRWLAKHGGTLQDYVFVPMGTRYRYLFLGIDKSSRKILGTLDIPAPITPVSS